MKFQVIFKITIDCGKKTIPATGWWHNQVEVKLTSSPVFLLKKFDCSAHDLTDTPLYIDEEFQVHQQYSGF